MGGRQGGETTTTTTIHSSRTRTGTLYIVSIGATGRTETGPIVTVVHR